MYTDFHSVTTSTTLTSSYKVSGSLSRDAHSLTLCLSLKDNRRKLPSIKGFPRSSVSKESACNAGDPGLIPGSGRSPGGGNGTPLHYSCLENPTDGGAWWATVHGVAKSWTELSDFTILTTSFISIQRKFALWIHSIFLYALFIYSSA